jgi:hypothetical protein
MRLEPSDIQPSNQFTLCWCCVRVPGSRRCAWWAQDLYWLEQNVPTSSLRRLTLLAPLLINARSRGYKWARDGGEAPKSLVVEVVALRATEWSSN